MGEHIKIWFDEIMGQFMVDFVNNDHFVVHINNVASVIYAKESSACRFLLESGIRANAYIEAVKTY